MKWASWLNLFIGIWLLFAPWAYRMGGPAASNSVVLGTLIIIVAIWSLAAAPRNITPAWINLFFGIWLFISPWVVGYAANRGALWNGVALGVLLVIFALARMSAPRIAAGPTV